MILMSKYKGQHGGKMGQKIRPPPLFSGNARKKSIFLCEVFPYAFFEGADPDIGGGLLNPGADEGGLAEVTHSIG